jgi:hypothetical protein
VAVNLDIDNTALAWQAVTRAAPVDADRPASVTARRSVSDGSTQRR